MSLHNIGECSGCGIYLLQIFNVELLTESDLEKIRQIKCVECSKEKCLII